MIAIVIPTWDNSKCLQITIDSLFRVTEGGGFRVIVVDNGSGAKTRDYLATQDVEVVRLNENQGFVKGTNAGLERVQDGEDVLLLNDDVCIVSPDWLDTLYIHLHADGANLGAVGPVTNLAIGQQNMLYGAPFEFYHDTKFLVGFCMLIKGAAFQSVGGLDERFGIGGCDDLDYSIRLRDAGYGLRVVRDSFVFHYGSMSINRIGGWKTIEEAGRSALMEKWGPKVLKELSNV